MYPYFLYGGSARLNEHKTKAEIDTKALEDNFRLLGRLSGEAVSICIVKADAYGHSTEICVPVLLSAGCRFFAVSCIEEALTVREICSAEGSDADILILGYTDPAQVKLLCENNIIQTAVSLSHAQRLSENAMMAGCVLRVHVAVDTGMNRIGLCVNSDESCVSAADDIERMSAMGGISVEGLFTHFSRSDDALDAALSPDSHTRAQANRFISLREIMLSRGKKFFCHACNSAAAVRFPEYRFDGVRLGIMLYGVYPSPDFESLGIRPVMSLKTVISHIHPLPAGETVGYGGAFRAERDMTIATLPIGYADGLLRKYSGAYVTVSGALGEYRAPIIGRICMDQCMIDVTDAAVDVGDTVTVFGSERESLRRLAELSESIEYECLCLISARVPRIKKQ